MTQTTQILKMHPNVSINHDGIFKTCLYYTQTQDLCITCGKQILVDTIGILSALRMRGLHDKRYILAKLRIAGSDNW